MKRTVEEASYILLCRIYEVEPDKAPDIPNNILESVYPRTVVDPITQCRIWQGPRTPLGYGHMGIGQSRFYIHRLVKFYIAANYDWELCQYLMSMPDIWICHTCDTPPCCNHEHLVIADAQYNTLDSIVKGRARLQNVELSSMVPA